MNYLKKKTNELKLTLIIAACSLFSIQSNAQVRLGGGLSYGSEIDQPGINLRAGAVLGTNLLIDADANFFFPGNDGYYDVDIIGFNLNGKILLVPDQTVYVYPMAGLNFTTIHTEFGEFNSSDTELGLNLGFGMGLNMGLIHPFAEAKYVISDYDQLVFTAGIVLSIGE